LRRLTRNLLDSSTDAAILAVETINRPSIAYRMEAFCILLCNAWELMMKAKLVNQGDRIFPRKKRGEERKSISLDECLGRIFSDSKNPVRLNVASISELRNNAMHLIVPFVPPDLMGLFQAGIVNYATCLREWFGRSLSDKVPIGMMTLVYDFDPAKYSLENARIHRRLPVETVKWLAEFQRGIHEQVNALGANSAGFFIPVNFTLATLKNPSNADIVAAQGPSASLPAVFVQVPKYPDQTHPYRGKDVLASLNKTLADGDKVNSYDLKCVNALFKVEQRAEFHYKGNFSSRQYSEGYVARLLEEYRKDPDFFRHTRAKFKIAPAGDTPN